MYSAGDGGRDSSGGGGGDSSAQLYHFHSLSEMYNGTKEPDLELTIKNLGDDSVEIELRNKRYNNQRQQLFKQLLLLIVLFGGSQAALLAAHQRWTTTLWDFAFLVYFIYLIYSLLKLIKAERLLLCRDFALQPQTVWFLGRVTNVFIPVSSIHDVVINEVIESYDVHYMLIVRTKGGLFKRKPIITLFNNLRPSVECLEVIYKNVNKSTKNTDHFIK